MGTFEKLPAKYPANINNTIIVFSSPARCPISVGHGEGSEERARPGPASMSKTEWGKKCMSIHKNISAQHEAWVFAKPVDTVALGLHDYHSIITRPMDLETVKTSMDSGTITTPDQFIADMQLIFQVPLCPAPRQREACQRRGPIPATNKKPGFAAPVSPMRALSRIVCGSFAARVHDSDADGGAQNAMRYNPPGTDVHIMAKKLLVMTETRWEKEKHAIDLKFKGGGAAPAPAGQSLLFCPSPLLAPRQLTCGAAGKRVAEEHL